MFEEGQNLNFSLSGSPSQPLSPSHASADDIAIQLEELERMLQIKSSLSLTFHFCLSSLLHAPSSLSLSLRIPLSRPSQCCVVFFFLLNCNTLLFIRKREKKGEYESTRETDSE